MAYNKTIGNNLVVNANAVGGLTHYAARRMYGGGKWKYAAAAGYRGRINKDVNVGRRLYRQPFHALTQTDITYLFAQRESKPAGAVARMDRILGMDRRVVVVWLTPERTPESPPECAGGNVHEGGEYGGEYG